MASNSLEYVGEGKVVFIASRFLWKIDKRLLVIGREVYSPNFMDEKQNKWMMKLRTRRFNIHIELIFLESCSGQNSFTVAMQLDWSPAYALAHDFSLLKSKMFSYQLGKPMESIPTFALELKGYSEIYLKIFYPGGNGESFKPRPKDFGLALALEELLANAKFSDVTIATSGKSFPAHKALLSARSPVLSAMFSHECSESKENRVDFSTFPEAVVQGFLEFIYTDKTEILPEYTVELLRIADMYQVDGLKTDAGIEISKALTVENAIQAFCLAYRYSAEDLKSKVKDFMKRNSAAIASNKSVIQKLAETRPDLVAELVMAING